ncbi:tyrosine-type recombinase/integrase [Flavobacterium piscisymbiosum]|uniref:Tyrosine-type recombinase/integrase n=1 Tax=Flavobacterium piscisymbiosum TaxID=2893753 RepID=A0ABS8MLB0_9FLAO|nr:tyrosine-type recombinase/integrase [Flavobacterium sp. F-30]MCC9066272.1 tyrosine-type recombinase/integrase [Flavobacterium sp. F-30]
MKSIYTIPKLVKYDDVSKPWFVFFRYSGKLFRYKYGINYIANLKKREAEANIICDALLQKLKEGWNPNVPDVVNNFSSLTFSEALDFAIEKKTPNLGSKTLCGYKSTVKFIKEALKATNMTKLLVADTKRIHIKLIIEKTKEQRKWSNKSFNKNLGYLKAILSELMQWDIIENNPAHGIKSLKVGEITAFTPATDEEVKLIKEKILAEFPSFYVYIISIFHTGIRPEELLHIKLKMIDLKKSQIILPPEITKTDIERIVPLNPFLKNYFEEMKLSDYPDEYFVFGSKREFTNRGLKKDLDFIPGPRRLNRDCASKLWRKLIIDGLKINVNMYSLKHLGANKKILAGVELDALRELYGHTSKMMTLRYAKVVKEVNRNQIMEKSPDF